jgi:transposase
MTHNSKVVIGGVDTHKDVHVAAAIDENGAMLGSRSFRTNRAGFHELCAWLRSFGQLAKVGVEGTGSYGSGLARFLETAGVQVVEVNRTDRRMRRRRGKSDTVDAEAAARAALSGEAMVTPKLRSGIVESIRVLRVALASARNGRTRAANQIRDLIVTGPDSLRDQLGPLSTEQRVVLCSRLRPGAELESPDQAVKLALRSLARRYQSLSVEIAELESGLDEFTARANPALRGAKGVGPDVAGILLVAAGDNPERVRNEASFAALCGASPVEASSGKTVRHRLNRAGNRQANHALWRIATVRLSYDPATQAYAKRRRTEGKSDREILRCLKRYAAREVYVLLTRPPRVPNAAELRASRLARGLSLRDVAKSLGTSGSYISQLERGLVHNTRFADRYERQLSLFGAKPAPEAPPGAPPGSANSFSQPAA